MTENILLPGRPPVVVLGHSIGAWMALHAMPALDTLELPPGAPSIKKLVCMFPFFESDFTIPRVRRLHKLSKHYTLVGACAGMVGSLPQCLKHTLFKAFASKGAFQGLLIRAVGLLVLLKSYSARIHMIPIARIARQATIGARNAETT